MKIVFATNNQHKLSEIRSILGDSIEVLSLKDIGCDVDIPETGTTLEENALQKAQYIYDHYHIDCFADDTGLEVDALDGAPGVYSARYAGEGHDSEANMTKLLNELGENNNRRARFRTVIVLIQKKNVCPCGCTSIKEIHQFEGIVEGMIIRERRGGEGFGYDPIFQPEGYDQTFAELGMDIKNKISHRARATQKLAEYLLKVIVLLFTFLPLNAQVGTWHNYLAYHDIQNICAADPYLFVLASNDLYQYNQNDQSITTYDKTNGLSDTHITHIAWSQQAKRLIIVYQNSNIDLIDVSGNITNISALYSKTMTEDKTVNQITIDGIYAWLHCAFGYVKVNMQRAEIADTYTPNHPEYPTSLPDYDEKKDLSKYQSVVATLSPGGPKYNHFYETKFYHGRLYTTGGYFLSGMNDPSYPGTVQVYDGNDWTIFEDELNKKTGYQYVDNNCIDIDPTDEEHVFVGGRCGLYEFKNGLLLNYYNKENSPLKGAIDGNNELGNNFVIVNSIQFDPDGNLWVLNSQAKEVNLLELTKDGTWNNHSKKSLQDNNGTGLTGLRSMFFDSRDYLWFVNTSWLDPAVFCYDKSSDELIKYTSFVNQDGTTYHPTYIYCVCEDKEKNIWIGTNIGPFMINSNEVGQESVVFNQIKVPRNDGTNYADYLLNGVYINHIAIDGGNRKWFATNGAGVFLISADNMTQIANFNKDNSYLLSDDILSIAINQQSGEIFFLADNGLSSYRSDATEPSEEMTDDTVWAYPNPVTPEYNGLITVTGLSFNADVKITASNGAVIAEGKSNGGTFTWDGCDKKGRRVASGVYMVITATSDGKKGTVCKIAVIN